MEEEKTLDKNEWQTVVVEEEDEGKRIDKFLSEFMPDMSRSYIQKLFGTGNVMRNEMGVKPGYKICAGDKISISIPEAVEPKIEPENIPLEILYEDQDVILINKQKGMVVHPAAGHYSGTLVNALMYHCHDQLSGINGVLRPGIVHRIDRDTTGVLIVCKNDMSHNNIAAQLKQHSITRRYYAVVYGNIKEEDGTVNAPIGRHPTDRKKMAINYKNGKEAVTHYRVVERFGKYTWIECRLETGRTHQIRVHMSSIGHPLLGDTVYGPTKCPYGFLTGQTLHAYILGFIHPRTGEYMEFCASLPDYFERLIRILRTES